MAYKNEGASTNGKQHASSYGVMPTEPSFDSPARITASQQLSYKASLV